MKMLKIAWKVEPYLKEEKADYFKLETVPAENSPILSFTLSGLQELQELFSLVHSWR